MFRIKAILRDVLLSTYKQDIEQFWSVHLGHIQGK